MAAMFRKSGNRKFRKKNFDIEEEQDDPNENHSTENNPINTKTKVEKVKSVSKVSKTISSNSLLSFDDEHEEESEVFQVKKSKESRRLSKKILKEKYKKTKPTEHLNDEGESNEKTRETSPVDVHENDSSRLEALRAELREMSKEDDEEDHDKNDDDNDEPEQADRILKPGATAGCHEFNIPDAATIHKLKKKREMARQLGTGQDFIPIDDSTKYEGRFDSKSRLIREDENDVSDDEDGPMSFAVPAKPDPPVLYGQMNNSGSEEEDEEEDEETKRWENEQMRKGVSASQVQQDNDKQGYGLTDSSYQAYMYPYGGGYSLESTPQTYKDDPPSKGPTKNTENVTIESVMNSLKTRLESLQETHRGHVLEKDKIVSHCEVSEQSIESLLQHGRDAEKQYGFYQEMRGYVRDLIECLNDKAPLIDALETSIHDLLQQRAQRIVDRRQEDVKDQANEFLVLQTGKQNQTTKPIIDEFGRDMTLYVEETKQRRAAEREGRRMRRRRKRELDGSHSSHHDGMSSDDEETETDLRQFKAESERISLQCQNIFEDVVDNFSSVTAVKQQFEKWKDHCGESYRNAYISLCLPKLFTLFIRIELMTWNPLNGDSQTLEDMQWYIKLLGFGFHDNEDIDPKDDDVKIIPSLIEKAVIPKLIGLVQLVWDPLSTTQTNKLIELIRSLADYPTVQAENKNTRQLFSAIVTRLKKSVNDDVYVPLYPKQLLENKSSSVLAFFQRQYWSCYKLFNNVLLWDGLLSAKALQQLALDGLLNRYLILGLQHSNLHYDNLEKCKLITNAIPKTWLSHLTDTTLPALETFSRFLGNLATCLQRSSAGCSDVERKKARSATKKIVQYLLALKAKGKASVLAREYGLDELIQ